MLVAEPDALLLLPHIKVQDANAISSPLTWGFPAMTAFTGFGHALHRCLYADFGIALDGVGIVSHYFDAQVSERAGKRTKIFHLRRHTLDQGGNPAVLIEEGRAHLEVSLIIGVRGCRNMGAFDLQRIAERAHELAYGKRIAGGTIISVDPGRSEYHAPKVVPWPTLPEERRKVSRKIALELLPGYTLVSREALLEQHIRRLKRKNPEADSLDALFDLSRVNIDPKSSYQTALTSGKDVTTGWRTRRKSARFIPIPVGYASLTRLHAPGEVKSARDAETPFRFVECLFTLGQWFGPHRLDDICQLLWYHNADVDAGLYRCSSPFFAKNLVI